MAQAQSSRMDGSGTTRWRCNPRYELHWRDWGGDSVVFELRSGHTHQFAPLTAAVMACFEAGDAAVEDVVLAIAGDLDVAVDEELRSAVTASVQQFIKLGWIEPIIHG